MTIQELYADSSCWCQGAMSKDYRGHSCPFDSHTAASWCIVGALNKCYPEMLPRFQAKQSIKAAIGQYHAAAYGIADGLWLGQWNDDPQTTFEMVAKLVKEANI